MANGAESGILLLLALLAIFIAVFVLLRSWLPVRSSPAYLFLSVFLAVALPASSILLVPTDLASSAKLQDEASKGVQLPVRLVLVSWRIIYWLTFFLTWVVLPLLGEYMDSGHRDTRSRIIYSLRSNGRYQLISLACAAAGLVYMIFSYGFDFTAIKGLLMALAYVWGLVLAIYLMGHGLVTIPRGLIRNASISGHLRRVQASAPRVHEKLEDALLTLEDVEGQVTQLKQHKRTVSPEYQEWIDDLAEPIGMSPRPITLATPASESSAKIPAVLTERYLADLTRRLTRARHQRSRYMEEWNRIVQTACQLQAIIDAHSSKKLLFTGPVNKTSRFGNYLLLTPTLRYYTYAKIFPVFSLLLGIILAAASTAVVFSEIIRFPAPQFSAVSITVIHNPNDEDYQIGLGGQLAASFWLTYMCTCALSSIADVPVWNQRALVHRNTSSESACWYGAQIARLTVPLAYNFLTFLPRHIHQSTTFYDFLGKLINLTPLGKWFDYLFPIFILLPVCATMFNLYGQIKKVLGFGMLDDESEELYPSAFGTGSWREGRDLIARDLEGAMASPSLGLLSTRSSPRVSTDITRSPRWQSPVRQSTARTNAIPARPSPLSRGALIPESESPDENFFTLFGKRVKNTIDTLEAPEWLPKANTAGLPKPKWMQGDGGSRGDGGLFGKLFNSNI